MKKIFSKNWLLSTAMLLCLASCQKEFSSGNTNPGETPVDLNSKVRSSVSGFVTDENNDPVQSAMVKVGVQTVSTDEYGYFEVADVEVTKNAATVTVTKAGFFPGIRTYMASNNKAAAVRIKLLAKSHVGTISAVNGGEVTLTNGLKVSLPANGVILAAGGTAYTGTVNVAAKWINPTAADLARIMPGDLRAIDADNNMKLLVTYGMAAVELTSGSGEKLQVAPGKKAKLTLPLPASIAGSAPASIPLWHFDESIGLWKEEGSATKVGNTYEGEVSHFSFWNCDVPSNFVQVNMTVTTTANVPIRWAEAKITNLANGQASWGYTDSTGYVGGAVPANAQLKLELFTNYSCLTPIHTQTFSTSSSNLSLGVIQINNSSMSATITGSVTNCTNAAVTNGAIYLKSGDQYGRYTVSSGGTYSIPFNLCGANSVPVTIIAEDYTSLQQSSEQTVTIVPGVNALANIQACGSSTNQFLNIKINAGTLESFTHPADTLNYFYNGQMNSSLSAYRQNTGSVSGVNLSFEHSGLSVGSTYTVTLFNSTFIPLNPATQTLTINSSTSSVNLTEVGPVGGFIAGSYVVNATGPAPANTAYNITGSFRMRRNN